MFYQDDGRILQLSVTVLSFGADGDSRELKNMQLSTELFTTPASKDIKSGSNLNNSIDSILSDWVSWIFSINKHQ